MEFGINFQSFEFRLLKKVKSGVKTKIDALRAGGHGWKFQHVSEHDCRKYVRSRVAPSPVKINKQMITDRWNGTKRRHAASSLPRGFIL